MGRPLAILSARIWITKPRVIYGGFSNGGFSCGIFILTIDKRKLTKMFLIKIS